MTPAAAADPALLRLLTEEQQLLTQFLELTQAQTPLIEAEDAAALAKNLDIRAQIIAKIDGMRPELDCLLQAYAKKPQSTPSADIADLQQQISRILAKITEIDNKNQQEVRKRMDFFQAELRRASDTRKGLGAYIKGAETFSAGFVDERQ